jgi:hypothetical protein
MLDTMGPIAPWIRNDSASASMMHIQRIPMERRRNDGLFQQKEVVTVLSLNRKTHLAILLFTIGQFAILDPHCILPLGIISWCCSLTLALELLHHMYFPPKHDFLKEQEFIQKQYERILFEYRVLKQSNKRIAIVNDKRGRPLAIVTID